MNLEKVGREGKREEEWKIVGRQWKKTAQRKSVPSAPSTHILDVRRSCMSQDSVD